MTGGKNLPWQCSTCLWLRRYMIGFGKRKKPFYMCREKAFALTRAKDGPCDRRLPDTEREWFQDEDSVW